LEIYLKKYVMDSYNFVVKALRNLKKALGVNKSSAIDCFGYWIFSSPMRLICSRGLLG